MLNKIAAHAGDLVKNRERAIKWDIEMTEERRTLNWEKQLSLSIDPEKAKDIHYRNTGQHAGNNVPCTMLWKSMPLLDVTTTMKYTKRVDDTE